MVRIAHFEQDFLGRKFLSALFAPLRFDRLSFWLRLRCSKSLRFLNARSDCIDTATGDIRLGAATQAIWQFQTPVRREAVHCAFSFPER